MCCKVRFLLKCCEMGFNQLQIDKSDNPLNIPMTLEPPGNSHPLNWIPELVWVTILRHAGQHPQTLAALLQAYPSLRRILHRPTWHFDLIISPLSRYLTWRSDLRPLLHVCKWWRHSVSQFLSFHPSFQPPNADQSIQVRSQFVNGLSHNRIFGNCLIPLEGVTHLSQFISTCQQNYPSGQCPFIGNAACFKFKFCRNHSTLPHIYLQAREFYQLIIQILEQFGNHLWHLEITLVYATYPTREMTTLYLLFRRVLEMVPNLKYLKLGDYRVDVDNPHRNPETEDMENVSQEDLDNLLNDHPLPVLPSMACLDVYRIFPQYRFDRQPIQAFSIVRHLLIQYCSRVQKLVIHPGLWCRLVSPPPEEDYTGQLVEVQLGHAWLSATNVDHFHQVLGHLKQSPNLQKLCITLWSWNMAAVLKLFRIMGEHLHVRILGLYLDNNDPEVGEVTSNNFDVVLEHLESLTIWLTGPVSRVEPVLLTCVPNLLWLKIPFCYFSEEEHDADTRTDEKTNLFWERLPKLETLIIGSQSFLRKQIAGCHKIVE